jgi:hypothetical protein
MALKQVLEIHDLLEQPHANGNGLLALLKNRQSVRDVSVTPVSGNQSDTEFVKITIPGQTGKIAGGDSPTLGIIGRAGGVGARPNIIGLVSDADGVIAALATACPHAPIIPHDPVPFMKSPVAPEIYNRYTVDDTMDAILSIDTSRGNRIVNHKGFAVTPTVKEGYILRVSDDLLDLIEYTTGKPAVVMSLTLQDITPYGNGIYHVNSIVQPSTGTTAPVVGVALTAETVIPGCATGTFQASDVEMVVRFCVEVAKGFGNGNCRFHDKNEFDKLVSKYGSMHHFQTQGN